MNAFDLFKMAVGNLLRRKGRTILTVLGIVIGTISIVLMYGLGLGMQESVNEQFASQSSAGIIEVSKGNNVSTTTRLSESEENDNLQDIDIDFLEGIEGVAAVSPIITQNVKLASGKYETQISVTGLDTTMMEALGYEVYDGRLPEVTDGYDLFFGITAAEGFEEVEDSSGGDSGGGFNFGSMDIDQMRQAFRDAGGGPGGGGGQMPTMGETEDEEPELNVDIYTDRITMSLDTSYSPQSGDTIIDADIYRINGVGLLVEGDRTRDQAAFMHIDNLVDLIESYDDDTGSETDDGYSEAYVLVENMDDVDMISDYIEAYDYSISTSSDFLETMQGTTETLTIALGAIGAVSLLVAAIGITNTMNMAIHERKKEIGVMKVIGATITDIKRLFLTESAIIGFIGGVVGIGISFGASYILSTDIFSSVASGQGVSRNPMDTLTSFNVVLPQWLLGVGLIFTTLLGVISGYIPARNAMRASALEAIKTE